MVSKELKAVRKRIHPVLTRCLRSPHKSEGTAGMASAPRNPQCALPPGAFSRMVAAASAPAGPLCPLWPPQHTATQLQICKQGSHEHSAELQFLGSAPQRKTMMPQEWKERACTEYIRPRCDGNHAVMQDLSAHGWGASMHVYIGQASQPSQLTRNEKGSSRFDCNPSCSRGMLGQEHASLARPCIPADVCAQVGDGVGNQYEHLQHRVPICIL